MRYYKFWLTVVCSFFTLLSSGAVFTVTTNAEYGAGSFREAIANAAANGSTETDYIYFNIPAATNADRTINITSSVNLSSNLVIDGTTQPSDKLGISDAKIIMVGKFTTSFDYATVYMFYIDGNDIAIYGLDINGSTINPKGNTTGIRVGQYNKCNNIQIGAAGKGNVFNDIAGQALDMPQAVNSFVKGNLIGTDETGTLLRGGVRYTNTDPGGAIYLGGSTNVQVGGDLHEERNIITGTIDATGGTDFKIINNYLGTDISGTKRLNLAGGYINLGSQAAQTVVIKNNLLPGGSDAPCLTLTYLQGFLVTGNIMGTDVTKTQVWGNLHGNNVIIDNCGTGVIGGPNTGDSNIICNANSGNPPTDYAIYGIKVINSAYVVVSRNSMYCNNGARSFGHDQYYPPMFSLYPLSHWAIPNGYVTALSDHLTSGTGTPGATIELFYTDECGGCEPKTYLASVIVGADGTWSYPGDFTNNGVVASATLNNNTSLFTTFKFKPFPAPVIVNASCGNSDGSITMERDPYIIGTIYQWKNDGGQVVGNEKSLANVPAGKYRLRATAFPLSNCAGCSIFSDVYTVTDGSPAVDVSKVVIAHVDCRNAVGSITGINPNGGTNVKWLDAEGKTVATTANLTNVPPGKYKFTEQFDACTSVTDYFEIKDNRIIINADAKNIVQPSCGTNNGSIKGIQVTATNHDNLFVAWLNAAGTTVASTLDVDKLPAGSYMLQVSNTDGSCMQTYGPVQLLDESRLTMNQANAKINAATCDLSNGSVTGF